MRVRAALGIGFSIMLTGAGCGGSIRQAHTVIYEDAESGLSPDWKVVKGDSVPVQLPGGYRSDYCVKLPVSWYRDDEGAWHNPHEYQLPLHNDSLKVLIVDIGGTGEEIPHYSIGVKVTTKYGKRNIDWDSWYSHVGKEAEYLPTSESSATLTFPSPVELVRGFGYADVHTWGHFRVDIEAYLKRFEPDNEVLSVDTFVASGGDLDNIGLTE